jgi:hypothetical protein
MKILLLIISIALNIGNAQLWAQRGESLKDYGVGWAAGQCLVRKCQVFRGFLLTGKPNSGESVALRIEEHLFGPTNSPTTVSLRFAESDDIRRRAFSPHRAWGWGVVFSAGAPVTVVRALENIADVAADDPVLVTSSDRTAAMIRSLAAEAGRLEASPSSVSDLVDSLSQEANPALAGYLFWYLTQRVVVAEPELETRLLGRMIESKSVPPEIWDELAAHIVLQYHRLSDTGRATVVTRLAQLGLSSDVRSAQAGFVGLARIAEFDDLSGKLADARKTDGLANAYKLLVRSGRISRNTSLESKLAIKYE